MGLKLPSPLGSESSPLEARQLQDLISPLWGHHKAPGGTTP